MLKEPRVLTLPQQSPGSSRQQPHECAMNYPCTLHLQALNIHTGKLCFFLPLREEMSLRMLNTLRKDFFCLGWVQFGVQEVMVA